jgi:hypothetical protein
MSRIHKISLLTVLLSTTLACGLISNPINQAKGLASTAEAMATSMPISTLQALSSAMPNITGMLNPTGQPVSNWNSIPVMPQATVGQEFNANSYSYKVPLPATDVQAFYDQQMKALGWQSQFGMQLSTEGGVLAYQKGSDIVTITIAPDSNNNKGSVVILQK